MSVKDFIEANRQKGSTTELVWAAIRADGYLVMPNLSLKQSVLKRFTALKPENVFTLPEIEKGTWKGREQRPVFFDTSCLAAPGAEDPMLGLTVKELLKRAKATKKEQADDASSQ